MGWFGGTSGGSECDAIVDGSESEIIVDGVEIVGSPCCSCSRSGALSGSALWIAGIGSGGGAVAVGVGKVREYEVSGSGSRISWI